MKSTLVIGVVAIVLMMLTASLLTSNQTARIDDWAGENGYTVLDCEKRIFDRGPYWLSDDAENVYFVTIRKGDNTRQVWFKFGVLGLSHTFEDER